MSDPTSKPKSKVTDPEWNPKDLINSDLDYYNLWMTAPPMLEMWAAMQAHFENEGDLEVMIIRGTPRSGEKKAVPVSFGVRNRETESATREESGEHPD